MPESQPPVDPYLPPADGLREATAGPERANGWATASLVLGIGGFCFWVFTGIPAIICGIIGLNKSNQPDVGGRGRAIAGIVTGAVSTVFIIIPAILLAMLLPAVNAAREAARSINSMSNMRQQGLGAMMYREENDHFPAAADASQGPPVSWRMTLAPYSEAQSVHDQYNVQEAWDSSRNLGALDEMPTVYRNPNQLDVPSETNYLALVGDETAFPPDGGTADIRISSQTVLFVEANADRAVPWTQPKDLDFDPANPLAGLGNFRPGTFLVAFADGSTQQISNDIDPEVFRAMVTRSSEDDNTIPARDWD